MLKDLTGGKAWEISDSLEGQQLLEDTLEKVSAFIYIDNVLDEAALRQLLPHDMNKAKKVRLLITARDKNVLKACPMKTAPKLYPMRGMSSTEAMSLLQKEMYEDPLRMLDSKQINDIINKCDGIPLMLNLAAAAVRTVQDEPQEVHKVIEELKSLKGEDFRVNKIENYFFAYDKLPEECKDPFLDICYFFHGRDRDTVANIVGESELKMLENRALVSKDTNGVASVHDIILELGRRKSEGVRFRFSSPSEVKELLDNTEEKDIQAIKGISLNRNRNPLDISAAKLDLMYNSLRVLAFGSSTQVKGECSKIFKKLIFFKAKITRLPFHVSKLKELRYLYYKPEDLKLSEMPSSLRHMELDGESHAHAFQISSNDLQQFVNLQILRLTNFKILKNLPKDMGNLVNNLKELSLSGCQSITELPESISKIHSLLILRIDGCSNLTELPVDFGSLNSLQELHLGFLNSLQELPNSVEKLSSLKLLDLSFCRKLLNLPPGLGNLRCLVKLGLTWCSALESIPESIRELKLLQPTFVMSGCKSLKELPHGFCNLSCITQLSLSICCSLAKLPDGFGELSRLRTLDLSYCRILEKLPKGFGRLKCLEELDLKCCYQLRELCNDFHALSSLRILDLSFCLKLQKLPADFHCLESLQYLYLGSCHKLEGKIWMDHLVKMKRLEVVHIKGSEQLVKRWEEIRREVHQSSSFTVNAGQELPLSEDQKEGIEKTLLLTFDGLLTTGQGEPIHLSDLPPDTLLLVFCDINVRFLWPLIEETIDEIQIEFKMIYIGPHYSKLPLKVQDKVFVGHMSETDVRGVLEKVCFTLDVDADEIIDAYYTSSRRCRCFQMEVRDGQSDKYLPSWKLLTDTEIEEFFLGNCRTYLRLKQIAETPQKSNMKLLRELFVPEEDEITHVFQKYQSEKDRPENSEPFTCGVDKLKGKNILLEMRSAYDRCDIRLSSLKEMYVMENERLNLEIISIPIAGVDRELLELNVYKKFSTEVPWLVLRNSLKGTVMFFLAKQCGWEGDEYGSDQSIIWLIESNGRILTYKPSVFCMLNKWDILFSYLESVSYQVRWGVKACPLMHTKIEELRREEWKQLKSMSSLMFLFNHLESVSSKVKEVMFQGKLVFLCIGGLDSIQNAMIELRDSSHIICIPVEMKSFDLTSNISKYHYYVWGETPEMVGMSSLNLWGDEGMRFWIRLLHLKEEINGMDDTDQQFCEMRRLLHSFPLMNEVKVFRYSMLFMFQDGKMVATCRTAIMKWLSEIRYHRNSEDKAGRLMQLLIKVSKNEANHDSSLPYVTHNIQTAATAIDEEETVDVDVDSLSKYTTDLLEHKEVYQLFEFNKGKRSSLPKVQHRWPTSGGFFMLKNFLSEGINANWAKDIISGHPEEEKWKSVTKSLLKEIGEEQWAAAGLLVVADVLEKFESVSANRNECLFLLDEMNRLAIYLKQVSKRSGLWTVMKREATGSIVRGAIMCSAQIDPSKFAMFVEKPIDTKQLSSFRWELGRKCDIMARSITDGLGSESGSLCEEMCNGVGIYFVTGDLASENENEDGCSSMAKASPTATTGEEEDLTPSACVPAQSLAASASSSSSS